MKSDAKLREDVMEELRWEPSVKETDIGVAVKEGVVTLSGFVESYAEKFAAERAVERVAGVRAIAEELKVRLPSALTRSDADIAHAAANALDWDTEVPAGVKAKVENGWVTLEGHCEWHYQRTAAERAVRYLSGVKGVTNLIGVVPKQPSPSEVKVKIREALRRRAETEADRIVVEASDGKVMLKGTVNSWRERSDVERAAWAAPGVSQVVDNISVTP